MEKGPERRNMDRSLLHTVSQEREVFLNEAHLRRLAESALMEDRAWQDVTSDVLVPEDQEGRGVIVAKAPGVVAGLPLAQVVFNAADPRLRWRALAEDGHTVAAGQRIATIEGCLASILRGERVALNYLCHLSGIATATAAVVRELRGTRCRLRDTRKTIPGLRSLQKYAVRMGGGLNHRMSLADGILVKDNHLAALRSRGLDIEDAVRLLRRAQPHLRIEIEVTTVEEARRAAAAGANELLLDNMTPAQMREVVALVGGMAHRPALEASGGITLANARAVAETGVDYISMGAITHSARALDMSLELELA